MRADSHENHFDREDIWAGSKEAQEAWSLRPEGLNLSLYVAECLSVPRGEGTQKSYGLSFKISIRSEGIYKPLIKNISIDKIYNCVNSRSKNLRDRMRM